MRSRYEHLRNTAEHQRRSGKSIRSISKDLGIPISTLSGWLRHIELTETQRSNLHQGWKSSLVKSREKASQRHKEMKAERISLICQRIDTEYQSIINSLDKQGLEIALAMLYVGEGTKKKAELGLGNSDPMIMQFYLYALEELYDISRQSLRISLHLRLDQDAVSVKKFWSKSLNLPVENFNYVLRDKRTKDKPTYADYYGVCYASGGGVEIQRRLVYLAKVLCATGNRRD